MGRKDGKSVGLLILSCYQICFISDEINFQPISWESAAETPCPKLLVMEQNFSARDEKLTPSWFLISWELSFDGCSLFLQIYTNRLRTQSSLSINWLPDHLAKWGMSWPGRCLINEFLKNVWAHTYTKKYSWHNQRPTFHLPSWNIFWVCCFFGEILNFYLMHFNPNGLPRNSWWHLSNPMS